jgi:integrase
MKLLALSVTEFLVIGDQAQMSKYSRKVRLTQRAVDAATPMDKDFYLWDQALTGFALKVMPSGRKTFILQYPSPSDRRTRRLTLGREADLTATYARKLAEAAREQLRNGEDPQEMKNARAAAWTVKQATEHWWPYLESKKLASSTLKLYQSHVQRFINKTTGNRKIGELEDTDIERVLTRVPGDIQRNRVRATLSSLIKFAIKHKQATENPVQQVERRQEGDRERFLEAEEFTRLQDALDELEAEGENQVALGALQLLMLTGARKNEILKLRWDEVNTKAKELRKREHKTARTDRKPHKPIFLNKAALDVLEQAITWRVVGNPYAFPAARSGRVQQHAGHFVGLQKVWVKVRNRAGLPDVRIHDLRHSAASVAISHGASLAVVGAMLGHKDPKTTARYAHLYDDPVRSAVDTVGQFVQKTRENGNGTKKVVPIKGVST